MVELKIIKSKEYIDELYILKNYVKYNSHDDFARNLELSINNSYCLSKNMEEDFNIVYGLFNQTKIIGTSKTHGGPIFFGNLKEAYYNLINNKSY